MKPFQKSTKRPRSFSSGALYTDVEFTHLRDPSEMTIVQYSEENFKTDFISVMITYFNL